MLFFGIVLNNNTNNVLIVEVIFALVFGVRLTKKEVILKMASVLQSAIGAVIGVIGLLIFSIIVAALNTDALGASTVSLINVVPVILAAVIVVSIVLTGFAMR